MTSWTAFHQDPLSMGFPRQEYESGFPFPCPGDVLHPGIGPETTALQGDFSGCNYRLRIPKKTRSSCCPLVTKSCLTLWDPMDSSPPGSSIHGDSPGKNTGVGCHALLLWIFLTRDQTCVSYVLHWQVGSLPLALPGKQVRV